MTPEADQSPIRPSTRRGCEVLAPCPRGGLSVAILAEMTARRRRRREKAVAQAQAKGEDTLRLRRRRV